MILKRIFAGILVVAINLGSSGFPQGRVVGLAPRDKLETILMKTAEYCARLKEISLFYVCQEEVLERTFEPYRILTWSRGWSTEEDAFHYDYQLIRREGIQESRILLSENGKIKDEKDAPLKTKRFFYRYIIFGPIGIFGLEAQALHSYEILKETTLWGRNVAVVNAIPNNKDEAKWLFGKAWIDQADGSILQIEWEETALGNYEAMLEFAKSIKAKPTLKHFSEYRFVKNGIRFPSRFEITEEYDQVSPVLGGKRRIRKSELMVKYANYKFFTVETEIR